MVLLTVFFLAGTRVTHIKEDVKARLTLSSRGASGGEGPRTHIQVLANSLIGSILSLLHAHQLRARAAAYASSHGPNPQGTMCFSWGGDVLVVGLIANYAAVAADTFSSELGILSRSEPRLITSLTLRKVPRGTNGGVTLAGLLAGLFGSMVIVTAAVLFLPACNPETAATLGGGTPWTTQERRKFMVSMVLWGALGSVLDSVLGATLQRSVRDERSGKIVEGQGSTRVLVSRDAERAVGGSMKRADAKAALLGGQDQSNVQKVDGSAVDDEQSETASPRAPAPKHRKSSFTDERPSRTVESGCDLLDNNGVNLVMAATMSVGSMAAAMWYWGLSVGDVLRP